MTRRFRPFLLIASLLFSQLALGGAHTLANGKVRDGHGRTSQTRLSAIGSLNEYPEGVFLHGFQIDAAGNNVPTVVMLNERMEESGYWTFDTPISEIFRLRNEIYLFDYRGVVYRFAERQWSIVEHWRFDPWSVTYPLADDFIVCHPAPLTKQESGTRPGGCRSLARGWEVELLWTKPTPKICGKELRVLIWLNGGRALQTLDLNDGHIVRTIVLPKKQTSARSFDLCKTSNQRQP